MDQTLPRQGTGITVRYWAAARAAAGVSENVVVGATVSDVLAAARGLHTDQPRFASVLAISSFLLGDRPLSTSDLSAVAVWPGDVIEVLPPFAGG